jgi:hypothetical protein
MRTYNGRKIIAIHWARRNIVAVYRGTHTLWKKISEAVSCIGSGMWNNVLPWLDEEGWKNRQD